MVRGLCSLCLCVWVVLCQVWDGTALLYVISVSDEPLGLLFVMRCFEVVLFCEKFALCLSVVDIGVRCERTSYWVSITISVLWYKTGCPESL